MSSAPEVEVDCPDGRRRTRARSLAAIAARDMPTELAASAYVEPRERTAIAIGESDTIGESDAETEAIVESASDTEAIGEIDADTEAAVAAVSKKRKLATCVHVDHAAGSSSGGEAGPAPGARADPDPPFVSYADRNQCPASIACAVPPGPSTSAVPPPHTYAERICVIKKVFNRQGEEMPYGYCILDYNKEFDYAVGDSVSSVFGIGSVLMSSSGFEVRGNVSVPGSLIPDRLLKVYFNGSSFAHVYRVV
jgi:hypothetical protein